MVCVSVVYVLHIFYTGTIGWMNMAYQDSSYDISTISNDSVPYLVWTLYCMFVFDAEGLKIKDILFEGNIFDGSL